MTELLQSQADSYLVVARRYRPQVFEELIGQEHIARALAGAITAGRVGHAYIFTGARGVGKTSTARILAKALNCEKGPTPVPCNECEICRSITTGEDVDVLEIDGASNRGIDEIRQLRQNVSVRPSRVRFKIYIIDEVHMLTKEAFNALLKTLEEPPEHVKFIFATTEPQKVPITILSRCQRFDFAGISPQAIEARLGTIARNEGVEVEPEALAILARRAAGSMRDGQSLLEQLLAAGGQKVTADAVTNLLGIAAAARIGRIAERLLARDAAGALAEMDSAVREGTDMGMLLEQLLGFFRDILLLAVGGSDDQIRFALPSQSEQIRIFSKKVGPETLLAAMQILDQSVGRTRMTVDTRTMAEMALVRISRLEDLDDLSDAIAHFRDHPVPIATDSKKNDRLTASKPRLPKSSRITDRLPAASPLPTGEKNRASREIEPPGSTPRGPIRSIPLTAATADALWHQAVESIGGILAGNASMAARVELDGPDRLVAIFDEKYTSCMEYCQRADHQERLRETLAAIAGSPVQLRLFLEKQEVHTKSPQSTRRSRR
ncbi:MAG: DNA polymerase III subunit gamma/tau, partial [Pirellulales bacterium]|nr:DNA polymerase III subunit gamma/tau [Pirellulales bacterium]